MGLSCPKCQSEQVQSISVIVSSGTSLNSGTVVGIGNSGAGFGTTNGVSQTNLAARFSRPRGPSWFLTIWLSFGLIFTAVWLFQISKLAPIVPLAIMVYLVRRDLIKSKEYKAQLAVWERLHNHGFFCFKCGNTFTA